jgi:hypothetical protein
LDRTFAEESAHLRIDLTCMSPDDGVRPILYYVKPGAGHQFCRAGACCGERHNAIARAVDHQGGTCMLARSRRKSSCQVGTHATLALAEALAAAFQLAWTACSLTRFPR